MGQDISLYIKDSAPEPHTWRWLFRMTVQVGASRGSSGGSSVRVLSSRGCCMAP